MRSKYDRKIILSYAYLNVVKLQGTFKLTLPSTFKILPRFCFKSTCFENRGDGTMHICRPQVKLERLHISEV